jgi:deoxyribodipyrimidine photo-lyase
MCAHSSDYAQYESLPGWALETLADHADDPRPTTYSMSELESARTSDPLWNACQRQLVREGIVHNYLRMLWGKKILQWSPDPREALETMIHLNNKYALDGRDPNSYSGIFWVLGRYDRAWGPERDIFGKVRYMTSESAQRKLRLKKYLEIYGAEQDSFAQD